MKKCGDNEDVLQLRHRLAAIHIKIFFADIYHRHSNAPSFRIFIYRGKLI